MLEDRLSFCLKADGFTLEPCYLTPGNPDSMEIGYSFIYNAVEFVCRVDEADEEAVVLVFYGFKNTESNDSKALPARLKRGLRSGFAELMWLLNYLRGKGFLRIKGYIWKDPKRKLEGASLERMQAFYEKMGAKLELEGQQTFMVYDLRPWNGFRDMHRYAPKAGEGLALG